MNLKLNANYGAINTVYWMTFGIVTSFASVLLLSRGYLNYEIGTIIALGSIISTILQPYIAHLADKLKKKTVLDVIIIISLVILVATLLLFVFTHKSIYLTVIYILLYALTLSIQPLLNVIVFKVNDLGYAVNFGVCRAMGSLGFSFICFALGILVERFGTIVITAIGVAVILLLLILLYRMNITVNRLALNIPKNTSEHSDDQAKFLAFIRHNLVFIIANIGIAGIFFSNVVLNTYLIQIIKPLGGTESDMGFILSLMALLEVPVLVSFEKIKAKIPIFFILTLGSISFVIKVLIMYLANDITSIYFAQIFQLSSFGLLMAGMIFFTDLIMKKSDAVKGQAIVTMATAISAIASSFIGGFIIDNYGIKSLLLLSTTIAFIGMSILLICVRRLIASKQL